MPPGDESCRTIARRGRALNTTVRDQPREPKIAVPMRTQVDPAAIAASKSADIPIDSVSTSSPAARTRSSDDASSRNQCVGSPLAGGIGREPSESQARQSGYLERERQDLVFADAALLRLARLIHLDQHVERRREMRALLVQTRRDLRAVDRMHPVKVFRRRFAVLLVCKAPMKCQVIRGREAPRSFCAASWA